jgi:ubiquinone/menaquinone biosynthesis C-methylase UbiE
MPRKRATTWREFWNGVNSIYVSDRHKLLHDRLVASQIAAFVPCPGATVLDYGCGDTTAAEVIASRCGRLILLDSASNVRAFLSARYDGHPKIQVVSPEQALTLPRGSLDLVVANSLLQYLSPLELDELLARLLTLLKPTGALVIGDVIPPDQSMIADAIELLRFGYEGEFALSALVGLARTAFSDYRRLRSSVGLSFYSEAEVLALLRSRGFIARRYRPNIGHNQSRMTFVA